MRSKIKARQTAFFQSRRTFIFRFAQGTLWAALLLLGLGAPRFLDSTFATSAVLSSRISSQPPNFTQTNNELPQIQKKDVPSPAVGNFEKRLPVISMKGSDTFSIPIVMYHYVRYRDPNDPGDVGLSVSPENFRAQLADLKKKGYQTITFRHVREQRLPAKPVILTFDDGYQNFYEVAFPELEKQNMVAVVYVIANFKKKEYLTDAEIVRLSNAGIEIGSHTLDHRLLDILLPEERRRQIQESRSQLERLTKKPIVSFAYPFGDYSLEAAREVHTTGYSYAVTTANVLADFSSPFRLGRFRAHDRPDLEFLN